MLLLAEGQTPAVSCHAATYSTPTKLPTHHTPPRTAHLPHHRHTTRRSYATVPVSLIRVVLTKSAHSTAFPHLYLPNYRCLNHVELFCLPRVRKQLHVPSTSHSHPRTAKQQSSPNDRLLWRSEVCAGFTKNVLPPSSRCKNPKPINI